MRSCGDPLSTNVKVDTALIKKDIKTKEKEVVIGNFGYIQKDKTITENLIFTIIYNFFLNCINTSFENSDFSYGPSLPSNPVK